MTPGPEPRDLRTLLGLPPDASLSQVRSTYEQHVNTAVRAGDHRHALRLSRAFDDLPLADRRGVYAGAGSLAPRFAADSDPVATRRSKRARRRRGGRRVGRRIAVRVAVYAIVVPVAVVVGVAVMLHLDPRVTGSGTSPSTPAPQLRLHQASAAPTDPGWQVPVDTPVGADGRVAVWCHDDAGNGTTSRIAPGQVFTCPAGQVAVVTGR